MADSTKLWGGRFSEDADETFAAFNRSIHFDKKLFQHDVRASIAHCNGLQRAGLISEGEADQIRSALNSIVDADVEDLLASQPNLPEDVHSLIESVLIAKIGDVGRKVHTGRSRNDQVATAFRLWMREAVDESVGRTILFMQRLLECAEHNIDVVIPGYTHLQKAQPVLFPHWCLAYFEMLRRDLERFDHVRTRINVMPLGSGALAGSGFPIERHLVAEELGFESITRNSLDGVSDRDFTIDFAGAASILMMHLSRFAEDLIIYSSDEFGFVELGDRISTGSSLMPQKKNPDAMELLRGKSARVFGGNISLLTLMKGLPLAYNKDMQEDKEAVFDIVETVMSSLDVAAVIVRNITLNRKRCSDSMGTGFMNATDLADYLVVKGVPFRSAHEIVGAMVSKSIELNCRLEELPTDVVKSFSSLIEDDFRERISLEMVLASKVVIGGTSRDRVASELADAKAFMTTLHA